MVEMFTVMYIYDVGLQSGVFMAGSLRQGV